MPIASPDDDAFLSTLAGLAQAGRLTEGPTPRFVLDRLDDLERRDAEGLVRRCRHLRRGGPACFLPFEAGRLSCGLCAAETLRRLQGTLEDSRCDACGEPVYALSGYVLLVGDMLVFVALCRPCRDAEVPA